jgi:hypothetical protein
MVEIAEIREMFRKDGVLVAEYHHQFSPPFVMHIALDVRILWSNNSKKPQ